MSSIYVKDELRAAVEAASGGKQTVLYTAGGQPSIMNIVPRFNLEDIDASLGSGVHPAFLVGGVEKSELFIGSYQGIIKNGELISLPGVDPTGSTLLDSFVSIARATGPGFHITTNVEFMALALWCWKNGYTPRGNTSYGRSDAAHHETAIRKDRGIPGDSSGSPRTLTGSGPVSWRHDNTPNGVSDLCGNIWEWAPGLRLMDGEIQVIPNNDAALPTTSLARSSTAWRAIRVSDGALVQPGTEGTLKYDAKDPSGSDIMLSDSVENRQGELGDNSLNGGAVSTQLKGILVKSGLNVPSIAKVLGLYPHVDNGEGPSDRIHMRNYGERIPFRGGAWNFSYTSGIFSAHIAYSRSHTGANVGARPAFVL